MKAYRRGLQDYEYGWLLAQKGQGAVADEIVKRVIPKALTEATGVIMGAKEGGASASGENTGGAVKATPAKKEPAWSEKVDDWYKMREDMAAALAK